MTAPAPIRILIAGGGLAGWMCAAALSRQLGSVASVTLVDSDGAADADAFYGSVTSPAAYTFNLRAGVEEPRLALDTTTAFSWGTRYQRWGRDQRTWVQCFPLPLPVINGVAFHQYLARFGIRELEPYLAGAAAASRGGFVHPIGERTGPLARAEYGYQFDAASYRTSFEAAATRQGVTRVRAPIASVDTYESGITGVRLADGQLLQADLYVDATGPAATLRTRLGERLPGDQPRGAFVSLRPTDKLGEPVRTVTSHDFGWQAETPVQGGLLRLTVFDPDARDAALAAHAAEPRERIEIACGWFGEPWAGNCVALGHAAQVLEPLTPAPMILLQRQIDRLLSLLPVTADSSIERRLYNRQTRDDHEHADLFQRALREPAQSEAVPEKLRVKLEQFESRGLLVSYDLEPFHVEDWTVLHFGMGRRATRHDRFADHEPEAALRRQLGEFAKSIEAVANALPSHHDYMKGFREYLRREKW